MDFTEHYTLVKFFGYFKAGLHDQCFGHGTPKNEHPCPKF
jgi:hypothetical protein